jgi:hypothetical protein
MRSHLVLALSFVVPSVAAAQANTVPGLQGRLIDVGEPTCFGRRGPAHPGGEIGMAISYYLCNPGSVPLPWFKPGWGPLPMDRDHPKFAFLVARATAQRIEQITDARTYVKHAHGAANAPSPCGTCIDPLVRNLLGVGCQDAYSAVTNRDRFYLGPADEIDPWTGIWLPVGSYFDRGDPEDPVPANRLDGVRSLTNGNFADPVKNLITLQEGDLLQPGRFFYAMHVVIEGEAADLHLDNLAWREMTPSWDGVTWNFSNAGAPTTGSVLDAWPGATVAHARNGHDDGHFFVAAKATEPTPGTWHYEYAVHDFDNARGAATLRIPVAAGTVVQNVGFRDIDADPLNDWTWTRAGDEFVFQASATNPLNWNQLFNFWFECGPRCKASWRSTRRGPAPAPTRSSSARRCPVARRPWPRSVPAAAAPGRRSPRRAGRCCRTLPSR